MFVPVEQLVDKNIGQYKLTKLIGMSVLSAVYEAAPEQGSPVMLTVFRLPDECVGEAWEVFMERFEYEAARLKGLQHPHVVPYYAFGEEFGYPYLITPFTANRTLADVLKFGACTPVQVLQLLKQIASGLDYVHSRGIVHGSLKPSNILLRDEPGSGPRVLLASVGLTQILEMRGIGQVSYSHPHLFSVAGTLLTNPAYLAPEVVQGAPSDARSDIYAVGIMIYEMLCGRPPFTGSDPLDVALQHLDQRVPPLQSLRPDLSSAFDNLMRRVLERDPSRRIQRGEKLVSAFERAMTNAPDAGNENVALTGQMLAANGARVKQLEQKWQGMPGITNDRMPSLVPEFAADMTGVARRGTSGQFRPPRSGALPPAASTGTGAGSSPSLIKPAAPGGQIFKSPTPSGIKPPIAPPPAAARVPSSEPLATQISAGQQAVKASQLLARQISPNGMPTSGRAPVPPMPAPPAAPNGYGAQMQGGQPYAMMQAPSQMQNEEYASQAYGGNGVAGMQAGAMYNNDPRYAQQPYMDGAGYGQQPYMDGAGYGQEDWSQEAPVAPDQRRRALVIVGGAVAAAVLGAGALNLLRIMRSNSTTQMDNNGTQVATPVGGHQNPGQTTPASTNKTTGTVIASQAKLATNASLDFTDPTSKHPSILIHLPNGNFVAYDKACTHQGVAVAYNPKTNTLICPLHGSVFDPTNKGAVLHGPAIIRLSPVAIHINADGSITAG